MNNTSFRSTLTFLCSNSMTLERAIEHDDAKDPFHESNRQAQVTVDQVALTNNRSVIANLGQRLALDIHGLPLSHLDFFSYLRK